MNRRDLQRLSNLRLREAKALLAKKFPCGAYYLAGYAVECALKACIAKKTKRYDFPDKNLAFEAYQHAPEKLIRAAELQEALREEQRVNADFARCWTQVIKWSESDRYSLDLDEAQAASLIDAIEDPTNGVLQWLKKYW